MAKKKRKATVRETLVRMKSILNKRGWVKGYYAKTKSGRITEYDSKAAVGYCITGARMLALSELDCDKPNKVRTLIGLCVPKPFRDSPEIFNDAGTTTKADVIAVIDCAIKKAQATASPKGRSVSIR